MKAWNSFPLSEWQEDRTNSIEHWQGSWSLRSSCFKSGPSVRVSMRKIGWMKEQLCRRAHLTFENWFGKTVCTHKLFCHRFVLVSSVLSYTLLRISILQNVIFYLLSRKNKGKLNSTSWSTISSNSNIYTLQIKGSYYLKIQRNTTTHCYAGFRSQED